MQDAGREETQHNEDERKQSDEGEEPQRVGGHPVLLESLCHHKGEGNSRGGISGHVNEEEKDGGLSRIHLEHLAGPDSQTHRAR